MGLSELITQLPELIGQAVEANQWLGYGAIFAAMFLENLFPPIPSELIMPLGGFYVQQGQLQFIPVVLAGLIGTVLGALPWYGIGRLINEQRIEQWLDRHGRWIGISSEELARSRRWFSRYGTALVFWGRLVPGIRTLISVAQTIQLILLPSGVEEESIDIVKKHYDVTAQHSTNVLTLAPGQNAINFRLLSRKRKAKFNDDMWQRLT